MKDRPLFSFSFTFSGFYRLGKVAIFRREVAILVFSGNFSSVGLTGDALRACKLEELHKSVFCKPYRCDPDTLSPEVTVTCAVGVVNPLKDSHVDVVNPVRRHAVRYRVFCSCFLMAFGTVFPLPPDSLRARTEKFLAALAQTKRISGSVILPVPLYENRIRHVTCFPALLLRLAHR